MAVFVELEDDDLELPNGVPKDWPVNGAVLKKIQPTAAVISSSPSDHTYEEDVHAQADVDEPAPSPGPQDADMTAPPAAARENPNRNRMTEALGCYPIVMAIAANIDLNALDSLSRTCRQIREGLLQYRKTLLSSSLHCSNENLPVDPEETLRYRARAGNWFYMEDTSRTNYKGKSGECARDLVSECRRCGTVVCRNCAIKPPASVVLRDRHRRLCKACIKTPLASVVKPRLPLQTSLNADAMQRLICKCYSHGVWLCQPCGRSIRGDDNEYRSIWRWHNQYGEVLGGLGTGIGDGDRGVPCGRASDCCAAHDQEQETDCDAEDAREAEGLLLGTTPSASGSPQPTMPHPWSQPSSTNSFSSLNSLQASLNGHGHTPVGTPGAVIADASRRTPSPALGPGYARHEIEGIGGVVKTKRLRMVKVGACVNEYEDEKASDEIMGREIKGKVRSWCGWCWRVIPGKKDEDIAKQSEAPGKGKLVRLDSDSSSSSGW